ncbi:hypothetical protein ABPG74_019527 [Tetrahymena malaccensis]
MNEENTLQYIKKLLDSDLSTQSDLKMYFNQFNNLQKAVENEEILKLREALCHCVNLINLDLKIRSSILDVQQIEILIEGLQNINTLNTLKIYMEQHNQNNNFSKVNFLLQFKCQQNQQYFYCQIMQNFRQLLKPYICNYLVELLPRRKIKLLQSCVIISIIEIDD